MVNCVQKGPCRLIVAFLAFETMKRDLVQDYYGCHSHLYVGAADSTVYSEFITKCMHLFVCVVFSLVEFFLIVVRFYFLLVLLCCGL